MKKFIFKSIYFILPFLILYLFNFLFYKQDEGGLIRIGYMYSNLSPKSIVQNKFSLQNKFTMVSEIDIEDKATFSVLTIGDSFSEQDSLGYKNYLANNKNISVLHVDRFLSGGNPIQKLVDLINGDLFDSINLKYIVLQSVEREFVQRCQEIDFTTSLKKESLIYEIKNHQVAKRNTDKPQNKITLFSEATIIYPLVNLQYFFTPKPIFSKTYKVKSSIKTLFTREPDNILFFEDDVAKLKFNNDTQKIEKSNHVINKISDKLLSKNIQLILLISPDKYDFYYPFIEKSYNFEEPLFFNYFNQLEKKYLYTSLNEVFYKNDKPIKDIYYYDDTHWSPIGAEITALEIIKLINNK